MTQTENKVIQCRRDTAANWASNNPVPKAGEWCFETDTGITKIGDGSTAYNSLVPFRQTTATTTELNKLHSLSTTNKELGYVHGVTSSIQTQINSKLAKADIQTSFGETLSDEKVASEKLVKNSLDAKQDGITVANNSMLKASVLSAMNIVGENNSGRRYDEPKTLAKMISAAHSTFDLSKFTVIGSPNITDDGIASGFSSSNYLTTPVSITNNIKIDCTFDYNNINSYQGIFYFNTSELRIMLIDNGAVGVYCSGSSLPLAYASKAALGNPQDNAKIRVVADITTSTSSVSIYVNNVLKYSLDKDSLSLNLTSSLLYIGKYFAQYLSSPIYLKQFSITVDGVEVFSGNKTGLDVIKPDDYAVVGTPTITSDGILTLADNSNCIYKQINYFGDANNFDIIFPLYLTGNNTSDVWDYRDLLNLRSGNSNVLRLYSQSKSSTGTSIVCSISGNNGTIYNLQVTPILDLSQQYLIKISKNENTYGVYYKTPQTDWTLFGSNRLITSSDTILYFDSLRFTQCASYERIDLNSIKFYVEDNLGYQPCLKIPYTLAANDKKFISPIYEDRAKDMAEQFGIAPYHILDEDNGNFAMPYGSVDSKVAPKILVDSGEGWEQFLDRTMIQRGTMTADTPVTFPCEDEFANTDYSLSCPYSAKTKTGFTPTVSGEYIAVGKV